MNDDDNFDFVYPPSENLYCPICHEIFENPVITRECSHSFCAKCIYQIENASCPLCRHKISFIDCHSNLILDQIVKDLPVFCKFRAFGCPSQIPLVNKQSHENQCEYAPASCPHAGRGCTFTGTKLELNSHLKSCVYQLLKGFIDETQKEIFQLRETIKHQADEIRDLKRKISGDHSVILSSTSPNLPSPISQEPELLISTNNNKVQSNGKEEEHLPDSPVEQDQQIQQESLENNNNQDQNLSDALDGSIAKEAWGISTFQCVQTIVGHNRGVTALVFAPKRKWLFSGSHDTTIRVWDLSQSPNNTNGDGTNSADPQSPPCRGVMQGHAYTIWAMVLSADEKRLFSTGSDGTIKCWETEKLELIATFPKLGGKIYALAIYGNLLFSAGSDRFIRIWDSTSFECIEQLSGHKECIWHLVLYENRLYSSSDDKTVKVWNLLQNYTCEHTIEQSSKVLALAVGSGMLCTGSADCKIRVWNAHSLEFLVELTEHNWEVWQLSIRDGWLFSGSFDHTIKVWNLTTLTCVKTLKGHKGYVHAISLGNKCLFSGSGDKAIKVWRKFPLD